ncbi:NK2R protein, partial [Illadopsis cleaveri]|nr:NK2R protein [Illadopsis cleaveri]
MGVFSVFNASDVLQAGSLEDSGNWTAATQFTQPGWRIALWAITYSFIVVTSIVGNVTVIWIILAHRRMRTATNYFIVNLALSDLLMSAFNTIFNFIYASHNVWYFGEEFCRFQNWFPITAVFVSIYSMTAVAAERQCSQLFPVEQRVKSGSNLSCWVMLLLGAPFWYHIAVIVLIYLLPLMVMFVAYSIIGITLWNTTAPGNHLNRVLYEHQVNAKKKFVKTMVVVVIIFAVCWLPYHIYFILGSFKEDIYQQKYIQQVYLAVFLLAMSSTMYNPIIYCCLNQRFRSGFKLAFRWCPCIKATEKDKLKLRSPSSYQATHRNSRIASFNTETQLNEKEKTSFTLTQLTL